MRDGMIDTERTYLDWENIKATAPPTPMPRFRRTSPRRCHVGRGTYSVLTGGLSYAPALLGSTGSGISFWIVHRFHARSTAVELSS